MRKRAYPEYKPSGIEWLGEIPEHWEIKPIKHVGQFYTGWTPPTGRDEYFIGDNLWANISDLGPKVLVDTAKRISDEAIKKSRLKLSPKGSLLFSFKLSIGQVSIAGADMYTNEAIATFPPGNSTDVAYLYWAAPFYIPHNADENIYGAKLLNQDLIKNARMAVPPEDEQRAIAAFLDRETARIDELIKKKERQIELLQEKRAAVISHAVTGKMMNDECGMMKKYDSGSPHHSSFITPHFKDSGIEWLGEIPEHWEVRRLKRIFKILNGSTPKSGEPSYWDGDIPWATPDDLGNLQGDTLNATRRTISDEGYKSCGTSLVPAGSLVLSTRAPIGYLAIAGVPLCTNQGCRCLVFRTEDETRFFYYQLLTARQHLESLGQGSTFQELSRDKLGAVYLVVPPLPEQRAIAAFLDRETARIDALIEKIRKSIDLLREYRTALITAAVTGKIDVREEAA